MNPFCFSSRSALVAPRRVSHSSPAILVNPGQVAPLVSLKCQARLIKTSWALRVRPGEASLKTAARAVALMVASDRRPAAPGACADTLSGEQCGGGDRRGGARRPARDAGR